MSWFKRKQITADPLDEVVRSAVAEQERRRNADDATNHLGTPHGQEYLEACRELDRLTSGLSAEEIADLVEHVTGHIRRDDLQLVMARLRAAQAMPEQPITPTYHERPRLVQMTTVDGVVKEQRAYWKRAGETENGIIKNEKEWYEKHGRNTFSFPRELREDLQLMTEARLVDEAEVNAFIGRYEAVAAQLRQFEPLYEKMRARENFENHSTLAAAMISGTGMMAAMNWFLTYVPIERQIGFGNGMTVSALLSLLVGGIGALFYGIFGENRRDQYKSWRSRQIRAQGVQIEYIPSEEVREVHDVADALVRKLNNPAAEIDVACLKEREMSLDSFLSRRTYGTVKGIQTLLKGMDKQQECYNMLIGLYRQSRELFLRGPPQAEEQL